MLLVMLSEDRCWLTEEEEVIAAVGNYECSSMTCKL